MNHSIHQHNTLSFAEYIDVDCVGNMNDRKSTTGGCFYMGNNLIALLCKIQNFISLSTIEDEHI